MSDMESMSGGVEGDDILNRNVKKLKVFAIRIFFLSISAAFISFMINLASLLNDKDGVDFTLAALVGKINFSTATIGFFVALVFSYSGLLYRSLMKYIRKDVVSHINDFKGDLLKQYHKQESTLALITKKIDSLTTIYDIQSKIVKAESHHYGKLFGQLTKQRLNRFDSDLEGIVKNNPYYIVKLVDPAREYVRIFVDLISNIIERGGTFQVVSNMLVWEEENFGGQDDRYLHANIDAAKNRDIKIVRIYMLREYNYLLEEERDTLSALIEKLKEHRDTIDQHGVSKDNFKMKVYCVSSRQEFHDRMTDCPSDNFAIWNVNKVHSVCTAVHYKVMSDYRYKINEICFTTDEVIVNSKLRVFEKMVSEGLDISDFIKKAESDLDSIPAVSITNDS